VGAGTRAAHFKAANEAALAAQSDPVLAGMFQRLGIKIPTNTIGVALGRSPPGWTWHHVPDRPGVMQLVPTSHHQGSAWQALLHPNREGGFKIWGADY
jgi:hypothetical protein